MNTEKFCLKWNDFQTNLCETFQNVRGEDDFSDITLVSEDKQHVKAHRVILAASSPFFKDLLQTNQHPQPLVYMRGVRGTTLEALVDFIYCGEANVLQEGIDTFLALAEEMQLKGLTGPQPDTEPPKQPSINGNSTKHHQTLIQEVLSRGTKAILKQENVITSQVTDNFEEYPVVKEADTYLDNTDVGELEEHLSSLIERVNGTWTCKMCGKTRRDKTDIKRHAETHIEGASHPCNTCGKTFRCSSTLRRHLSTNHLNSVSRTTNTLHSHKSVHHRN